MRDTIAGALLALSMLASPALAQNDGRYGGDGKFAQWFSTQHAKDRVTGEEQAGGWCCDLADGWRYDDSYKINADGTVTLQGAKQNITIEAYKVLDGSTAAFGNEVRGGPNPTGHAIIWTTSASQPASDASNVFCFSPGSFG